MRNFELVEGSSAKFWAIARSGASVTTSWGRIGTEGQSKTKVFPSAVEAEAEEARLVAEKTRKGYQAVDGDAVAPAPPTKAGAKSAEKTAEKEPAAKKTGKKSAAVVGAVQAPAKAPAKASTAASAGPRPAAPAFDGGTNRYVHASGERVDLRVAEGDYPDGIPLSGTSSSAGQICCSPVETRFAVAVARLAKPESSVHVLAEREGSWVEQHVLHVVDFTVRSIAWSLDGRSLHVGFEGRPYTPHAEKGLVVTFDADTGKETARFAVPDPAFYVRVHPKEQGLLVTTYKGTWHHDAKGARIKQLSKGRLLPDPSGEWSVHRTRLNGTYVADAKGTSVLDLVPDFLPVDWFGPAELCAYLREPKPGLYRIGLAKGRAPELRFLGAIDLEPREDLRVSPDGKLIGGLNKGPSTLDLHDATTAKRVRRLRFPKGNSETYFAFAPDGRIAGTVGWQDVVHLYGTDPKFGVTLRSAPSEADKRKVSQKFFETPALARAEAEKQVVALTKKGFVLESIDPPDGDDERERLELLRRIHAGPLAMTARTSFGPVLGPKGSAARATRFRAAPTLTKGEAPPHCPSCKKPLTCLAELDLASLPEASGLRGAGLVQVLYCTNLEIDCVSATEGWQPGKGRSKLVRLVSGVGTAAPSPEGTEVIDWLPELDAPDTEDLERASGMKAAKALKAAKVEPWPGAVGGDKIGGFPAWLHPPEYPKCPRCKGELSELVLQLDSDGVAGLRFGDMGTAYVLRCPTHQDELDLIAQSH